MGDPREKDSQPKIGETPLDEATGRHLLELVRSELTLEHSELKGDKNEEKIASEVDETIIDVTAEMTAEAALNEGSETAEK